MLYNDGRNFHVAGFGPSFLPWSPHCVCCHCRLENIDGCENMTEIVISWSLYWETGRMGFHNHAYMSRNVNLNLTYICQVSG